MSNVDKFRSIADLAYTSETVKSIVGAIELSGFYTWDKFDRIVHVTQCKKDKFSKELYQTVIDELAVGYQKDDDAPEYFYNMIMNGGPKLNHCGWAESRLPDFKSTQSQQQQQEQESIDMIKSIEMPLYALVLSEIKKKDDWYDCIFDALIHYRRDNHSDPSEFKLWIYLYSGKPKGWGLEVYNDKEISLSGALLSRENFRKRYNKYFQIPSDKGK